MASKTRVIDVVRDDGPLSWRGKLKALFRWLI